jgi:predicted kinase
MKSLSLQRPLMLMIIGLPGAGKSFFARQFSDTFGVPVISIDRLRHELYRTPTFSKDEQHLLERVADLMAGELAKTKRSFIIDGRCDSRAQRQAVEKLATAHGYSTLVIWIQTDQATAKLRATKRRPERIDDAFNPNLTPEQFATLAKQFAAPTREDYVVISGKHAYSTQAKMVLRKLAAPHVAQAQSAQYSARRTLVSG